MFQVRLLERRRFCLTRAGAPLEGRPNSAFATPLFLGIFDEKRLFGEAFEMAHRKRAPFLAVVVLVGLARVNEMSLIGGQQLHRVEDRGTQ
jgi:hypothetical protein